jgi:hypothetical protein
LMAGETRTIWPICPSRPSTVSSTAQRAGGGNHPGPLVPAACWDIRTLLGGQKTPLPQLRLEGAGGCQANDLGDHVVDARPDGIAQIVPSLGLAAELGVTCTHQDGLVRDGQSFEHPIRGSIL